MGSTTCSIQVLQSFKPFLRVWETAKGNFLKLLGAVLIQTAPAKAATTSPSLFAAISSSVWALFTLCCFLACQAVFPLLGVSPTFLLKALKAVDWKQLTGYNDWQAARTCLLNQKKRRKVKKCHMVELFHWTSSSSILKGDEAREGTECHSGRIMHMFIVHHPLAHLLQANCFPWQLYHTRGFLQAM